MEDDNYVSHGRKLLREFDRTMNRMRGVFVSRYGEESEAMIHKTCQEYEALIPQLPYSGGKQPFTQFLISTA